MLIRRIALLYVVLALCRIVFYLHNAPLLRSIAWSEWGSLLAQSLKFDTASIVCANGVFILLSLLPFHFRERGWFRKLLFGYFVVVNTLFIVLLNLADCIHFRYMQKRFTVFETHFVENENSLRVAGKFLAENWYLGATGMLLIALLMWGYGETIREKSLQPRRWHNNVGGAAILIIAMSLGIVGAKNCLISPIIHSNIIYYTYDNGKANLIQSNPFFMLRTSIVSKQIDYNKYISTQELPKHFTPIHQPARNPAINLVGRNVVLFILESMSAEHSLYLCPEIYSDREIKGFTPFLDSLMRSSLCFRNLHANGTRSIEAMPSILGSIPSFKTPFIQMPQSQGPSRQLPTMLAEMGYTNSFFCGSERSSMGFADYASSAGIPHLVCREEYERHHGTSDYDGYWGIWDGKFLPYAVEHLAATPKPFFATIFTLTSHHPFIVPPEFENSLPEGYTKIHKSVAYVDLTFRHLFESIGKQEWFQNTIFVFVADHVSTQKFAQKTSEYPGNMHIMGFIYTPDGTLRGEVTQITQQLDVMPTLLGLLGNDQHYFAFGRDLFNEPERPCWSVSYDERFRALTDQATLHFDDLRWDVTSHAASSHAPSDSERLLQSFQALVQQYYSHAKRQSYLPHD